MFSVGDKVQICAGRYKGKTGEVRFVVDDLCYVTTQIDVVLNTMSVFGRYTDGVWIRVDDLKSTHTV